jgi:uncharacterized membrane protein YeaQ/YmgE (transglycosylase-associated protein family)
MNILLWIILGGIAGWSGSVLMASDHSMLEDIILGIIGAFIGGFLMNSLDTPGVTGFNIYSFLVALLGACMLLFIGRMIHA